MAIPIPIPDVDTKPFALALAEQEDLASIVTCLIAAASTAIATDSRTTFMMLLANMLSTFGGNAAVNAAAIQWLHEEAYRPTLRRSHQ